MAKKLLLFDIGNTTTKVGIAEGDSRAEFILRTDASLTSDNVGLQLLALLAHAGHRPDSFAACVASSVVPTVDPLLGRAVARYLGCPLLFVPDDLPIPLENRYRNPSEVGADRLVGAYAARRLHPDVPGLIVVDFGTALTFDCVQGNAYLGGLIFPGPQTALAALAGKTAKLPHVNLETTASEPQPGRDTVTSIRHGILFGYASLVEGLVAKLARGLDGPVRVVGTGGFADTVARLCEGIDEVRHGLLLEGLEMIFRSR